MTIGSVLLLAGMTCIVIGILSLGWLVFMVVCREQHAKITDAENSFWARRGAIQPATAAKIAQFENGPAMKAVYAVQGVLLMLIGVAALVLHVHPEFFRRHSHTERLHQRPAPSPSAKPANSNS